MIEIFETCQTKPIAKQTNMDESLIIRSIICTYSLVLVPVGFSISLKIQAEATSDSTIRQPIKMTLQIAEEQCLSLRLKHFLIRNSWRRLRSIKLNYFVFHDILFFLHHPMRPHRGWAWSVQGINKSSTDNSLGVDLYTACQALTAYF